MPSSAEAVLKGLDGPTYTADWLELELVDGRASSSSYQGVKSMWPSRMLMHAKICRQPGLLRACTGRDMHDINAQQKLEIQRVDGLVHAGLNRAETASCLPDD